MITKDTLSYQDYAGDNSTLAFAIPFPTFEKESLIITVEDITQDPTVITTLTYGVDFILDDLNVNGVDATLTLIDSAQAWIDTGLSSDYILHINTEINAFQPGHFRALGNYSPITLENVLDRFAMNIKSLKRYIDTISAKVEQNILDIATNAAAIAQNAIDIAANNALIIALQNFLFSNNQALTPAGTSIAITNATINILADKHMVFEYVAIRGTSVQFGRELITGPDPFNSHTLEKVGDIGLTILVTTSAGTGQVRYTITGGLAGEISYRIYKYRQ